MAWFAWQSALFILLGFLLGVLVGWWVWRIQFRRVAFTESEAVTVISRRHERVLAEKESEIARLQAAAAAGALAPAAAASEVASSETASSESADAEVPAADAAPSAAGTAVVAPAEQAERVDVVELPESSEPVHGVVVDVTDGAVEASTTAGRRAPAPSADPDVIDLASLETAAPGESPDDATPAAEGATDAAPEAGAGSQGEQADASPSEAVETPETPETGAPAEPSAAGQVGEAAEPAETSGAHPVAVPAQAGDPVEGVAAEPPSDTEPDSADDDLERIEGIGPRIASALQSAGIRSFRRLADADVPTLQAALEAAGLRLAPSLPTWSRQARFLADGDELGFVRLTESLVAGREPGRSR